MQIHGLTETCTQEPTSVSTPCSPDTASVSRFSHPRIKRTGSQCLWWCWCWDWFGHKSRSFTLRLGSSLQVNSCFGKTDLHVLTSIEWITDVRLSCALTDSTSLWDKDVFCKALFVSFLSVHSTDAVVIASDFHAHFGYLTQTGRYIAHKCAVPADQTSNNDGLIEACSHHWLFLFICPLPSLHWVGLSLLTPWLVTGDKVQSTIVDHSGPQKWPQIMLWFVLTFSCALSVDIIIRKPAVMHSCI